MRQAVKLRKPRLPLGIARKDQSGKHRSVNRTVRAQDPVSEMRRKRTCERRGTIDKCVIYNIGIKTRYAALLKKLLGGGFSRSASAAQTNDHIVQPTQFPMNG